MEKVLVVVDNLEFGGVAKVARNFSNYCSLNSNIIFDYVCYVLPSKETINELVKNGSKYFVVPRVSETTIPRYIKTLRNIIKKNGQYKAVHAHTAYFIWLACYAAKKENVGIRIGHAHGSVGPYSTMIKKQSPHKVALSKLVEASGRVLNRKYCTHMLACADKSGEYTFGSNFEFMPNITNYEGVRVLKDEQKLDYYKEFNIPEDAVALGYLGVIGLLKNTKFLVPLMKKVVESHNGVYMILAGNGPDEDLIKNLIEQENLSSRIKLIGHRSDNHELLQFFDVLVMPSFTEGMSLSILEAQLCGTPSVVSVGVPKTNDMGIGLFHQPGTYNIEEWVLHIEEALGSSSSMTRNDRFQLIRNSVYDVDNITKRLIEIYNSN